MDFTHPFTPYASAWAGLHAYARTFTAATGDPDRVRRCRLVRLHARSQPDTMQASPRCTEVGNASNRVRTKSTARRVVVPHEMGIKMVVYTILTQKIQDSRFNTAQRGNTQRTRDPGKPRTPSQKCIRARNKGRASDYAGHRTRQANV